MRIHLVWLLALAFLPASQAHEVVQGFSGDTCHFEYRPERVSQKKVEAIVLLHPSQHPSFTFMDVLSAGQVQKEGKRYLDRLEKISLPKEYAPLTQYQINPVKFQLWINETEADFNVKQEAEILKRKFGNIDPGVLCDSHIQRALLKDGDLFTRLAPWHNCVNGVFQNGRPKFPEKTWKKLLKHYGITEHCETEVVD